MGSYCSFPWDHWRRCLTCHGTSSASSHPLYVEGQPMRCPTPPAFLGCYGWMLSRSWVVLCLSATQHEVWSMDGIFVMSTEIERKCLETFIAFWLSNFMLNLTVKQLGLSYHILFFSVHFSSSSFVLYLQSVSQQWIGEKNDSSSKIAWKWLPQFKQDISVWEARGTLCRQEVTAGLTWWGKSGPTQSWSL